jgi:DNA-binding NarL/FixJ family response regulator
MAQPVQAEPVSIYLVAENRLFRQMLIRLLRKRPDICIVGDSCYSESAGEEIAASKCDVLLMDFLATTSTTDLTKRVLEVAPSTKVIMFGMDHDPDTFLQAVRSGACGYVLKDASAAELVTAVRGVMQGEAVCPPTLCRTLFQFVSGEFHEMPPTAPLQGASSQRVLTYRQRQLVSLVALGKTNKEIAASLNLSEFTVKNHIRRIMRQVDVRTRQAAVDALRAQGTLPS